ncbi:hypothetical protein ANANG_G00169060, partial [Anguilla anguilla]
MTLQAFGRRSYPERHTTKCITITRNKYDETPREKYRSKCREQPHSSTWTLNVKLINTNTTRTATTQSMEKIQAVVKTVNAPKSPTKQLPSYNPKLTVIYRGVGRDGERCSLKR